jgi:hypothetical protein
LEAQSLANIEDEEHKANLRESLNAADIANDAERMRMRADQDSRAEITDDYGQTDPLAKPGSERCNQHDQAKILNEINSAHQC